MLGYNKVKFGKEVVKEVGQPTRRPGGAFRTQGRLPRTLVVAGNDEDSVLSALKNGLLGVWEVGV